MKLPRTAIALAIAALTLAAGPGLRAQNLTEDQLKTLFLNQMNHVSGAGTETDSGLGASRGLVLTKVAPAGGEGSAETAPVTVERGADPANGDGLQLQPPAADLAAVKSGNAPAVYVTLPKEEQVNFQVKFAFDSAALTPDQKPGLRTVCAAIKSADVAHFRIIGHTDASGDARYNQKLSDLRAEEVQRFFVTDCGIAPGRLEAVGVGEQFPFDAAKPRAGVNRRVEFQALS
jgi:OmpA-OmpF porin, OOP family